MINCPNCNTNGISRKQLILQELTIPGVKAVCENCETHVGIKQDGWILSFWVEILFFAAIFISAIYFNILLGVVVFLVWSFIRMLIKSIGKLEQYE